MMKVGFGKTEGDAAWSKWVAEHMAESAKPEHRAYLIFLERYVEMGEAAEAALAEPSHTKKVPKSKPMPKARLPVTSGHMSEPEASEEDSWALLEEPAGSEPLRAEVLMLRGRMWR